MFRFHGNGNVYYISVWSFISGTCIWFLTAAKCVFTFKGRYHTAPMLYGEEEGGKT